MGYVKAVARKIKKDKEKRDFAKSRIENNISSTYDRVNRRRISVAHAKESGKV